MYRVSFLILAFSFLVVSCNSDDDSSAVDTPEAEANFYALTVGNSWTYRYFGVSYEDQSLNDTGIDLVVEVTEELELNNETYYKLLRTASSSDCIDCIDGEVPDLIVRDSLGYLINEHGAILYSRFDTEDYLISDNDWGNVYRVLLEGETQQVVPAGEFTVINNERYALEEDGTPYLGTDDLFYADGIGEVKQTYAGVISGRIFFEKHLTSYELVED